MVPKPLELISWSIQQKVKVVDCKRYIVAGTVLGKTTQEMRFGACAVSTRNRRCHQLDGILMGQHISNHQFSM